MQYLPVVCIIFDLLSHFLFPGLKGNRIYSINMTYFCSLVIYQHDEHLLHETDLHMQIFICAIDL